MSHKKTNSAIHVPFSWEKMPGVPKFMSSPMCSLVHGLSRNEVQKKANLPLPPGSFRKPLRSVSKRVFSWGEDPFLAALIECSQNFDNYKGTNEMKKRFGSRVWTNKFFVSSCKQSFDVEEGHLSMRPSGLGCNRK